MPNVSRPPELDAFAATLEAAERDGEAQALDAEAVLGELDGLIATAAAGR